MVTRIEIVITENKSGLIATTTSLDCHKSGHTDKELSVANDLQDIIFGWLETELNAIKLTHNHEDIRNDN